MSRLFIAIVLAGVLAPPVAAQRWAVDLYAGGTQYRAVAGQSSPGATSLVGNLRFRHSALSLFATAAAPLTDGTPAWGALGGAARLLTAPATFRIGIDVVADGFVYRPAAGLEGAGLTLAALPLVLLETGAVNVELQGGRRDYLHHQSNASMQRHLYEGTARISTYVSRVNVAAEARVLQLNGAGAIPFAGVRAAAPLGPAQVWASAGRWLDDTLDDVTWNAGVSVPLLRGELWAVARRDAADPLYDSPARSSWNVGYSLPLGTSPQRAAFAPVARDGRVTIRLARAGRAAAGPVSVAGDFNGWTPLPMQEAGAVWELTHAIPPGVVRFAFVDAAGEWFVPDGYPGRIDDDMGGHLVLYVVP